MDRRRPLSQKELEALIEDIEEISDSEPFSADSSDNYEPDSDEEAGSDTSDMSNSDIDFAPSPQVTVGRNQVLDWVIPDETFAPAKILPPERECKLAPDITKQLTPMQIFHKRSMHDFELKNVLCFSSETPKCKTYYNEDLLSRFKYTFSKCRQDSQYQSIDESMTKFKDPSSLKQYMPLKPTKRGIKLWLRCDADSGYTYDVNVYSGKEDPIPAKNQSLTLGERVVTALASTVKENNVVLCFDRFFTSVNLLLTPDYAALGTCMSNRKNVSTMGDKLQKGESQFKCTSSGLLCVKWQDTKEVLLMSNCHKPNLTTIIKKSKTGEQQNIQCPEAISFYRKKCKGLIGQISSLGYMIMTENQQSGGKRCSTHCSICVQ
ncbi:unnamed protein product [Acanthoscelides obtectus]|uniref:PiggyBac transposable element-derived protein domain-containing protein n=1 Tax=Acanthoscelides obtectus TaxID=200917 RepID=A0A9P0KXV1_ACAOB|nr:unnamed protein product [Acanthoscelides obtectus]CAK1626316.1 PiggyBac transposable element-derived protein 4 [Acanthoscelides obtectus]